MIPISLLIWFAAYSHAILPRSMAIKGTHASQNLAVKYECTYATPFILFKLLTSSPSLPPIPPGIHIVCRFDNQIPVDSVGAYMVIIKAIVRLSAQP